MLLTGEQLVAVAHYKHLPCRLITHQVSAPPIGSEIKVRADGWPHKIELLLDGTRIGTWHRDTQIFSNGFESGNLSAWEVSSD